MKPSIANHVWQSSRIAFAVTDSQLIIRELGGDWASVDNTLAHSVGLPLLNVVTELVGNEQALADILAGKLPGLKLNLVNREGAQGEIRYLLMEELPDSDEAGGITGIVHLVQDVTERGAATQELSQGRNELQLLRDQIARQNVELTAANAELRNQDELRTQFIARAARELTTITESVQMLMGQQAGPLTEPQRARLEVVEKTAYELLARANDMLDFARLRAGQVKLVLQKVDLKALAQAAADDYRGQMQAKKQGLVVDLADGLPQALCDQRRARQILNILLSNASLYTPEGGRVSVHVQPHENPGLLQVTVRDTGVGITASEQAGIFTPGFRTEFGRALNPTGAGLGLCIARMLADLHGGFMSFESQPENGSAFHVTFLAAL